MGTRTAHTPGGADPLPVPEIFCPFPYRVNPHADRARAQLAQWVRRTGLVHRELAARRFDRADFGWFVSVVHPGAEGRRLELMADWFAWLFLVDDQLDDGGAGRDQEGLGHLVDGVRGVLEAADFGAGVRHDRGVPLVVSSLADLWCRTAPQASVRWRRRFVRHLWDCLVAATVWEAGNRVRGVVPDEAAYIEQRRHTGAIYVCMDLIEIVEGIDVPGDLYGSAEFTAALDAACDVVCWTNDVYSLDKERALGEVHNLAYLVQYHRGLDRERALEEVCAAISARTERFLAAEKELLAARPGDAASLVPYAAGMRTWIRGNLDWSRRTKRYQDPAAGAADRPVEYVEPCLMGVAR
ncbi:terpene cyclase [Streptomyces sp. NPDC102274]|uniref:terpene synthase family protein n=1 Tax=Streptomyces sp. NPDC102274 TaxID=3366151 RepID=UPI0037F8B4F9